MEGSIDTTSVNFTDEQLIADLTKDGIKTTAKLINDAKKNDAKAQASIGSLYLEKKIRDKAYAWFLKSALQGNADAQCALAEGYKECEYWYEGGGDSKYSKSTKLAYEWCQKAVDQGHAEAHGVMGHLLDLDQNDHMESLPWYHQAVFLGAEGWSWGIESWDEMGERYHLRPAEIKKAQAKVMKWLKKNNSPEDLVKTLEEKNAALKEELEGKESAYQMFLKDLQEKEEEYNRLEEDLGKMYEYESEARELRERIKYLEQKN